jgi:PDDEXK-like domain of unknown function (DUF3799)
VTGELLTIPAAEYHADPCDTPSLSSSVAKTLIAKSPRHAAFEHPKLNPDYTRKEDGKFRLGNAVHALFLEGRNAVGVVAAKAWNTTDAKAMRDEILAEGRIPMLTSQWAEVEAMCEAIRAQLPTLDVDPPMFSNGKPEQTLVWEEDGVTCRALIDWLHDDHTVIDDLKTTSASANPEQWPRTMYGFSGDVQVAFHARGVKAVFGVEPEFRFLVAETEPPYVVKVHRLGAAALAIAQDKVETAIRLWRDCITANDWPAYGSDAHLIEIPAWEEARWLDKTWEYKEEAAV